MLAPRKKQELEGEDPSVTGGLLTIVWDDPDDCGGIPIISHELQLGLKQKDSSVIDYYYLQLSDTEPTYTYTKGNLKRDTTYYFRVRARNDVGKGPWSNALEISTLKRATLPTMFPPPRLYGTPTGGSFSITFDDGSTIIKNQPQFGSVLSTETSRTVCSTPITRRCF